MPKIWDMLPSSEKDSRLNFQAVSEENMLLASETKYWEEYNRATDEGYPEQSLLDQCVVQLTPLFQQWIDTVAKGRKTPEWSYPLFAVGAGKMADITVRVLILEWFNASFWDKKHEGETFPLPTAQYIAHRIADMVIDIVSYRQVKKQFKVDWFKQSHYQKNWTVKRCKAFSNKMGGLNRKQFLRKQREDFGHHMLRIAECSKIIELKNIRKFVHKRWTERVYVGFSDEVLAELTKRHADMVTKAALLFRPMIVPPVPHTNEASGGCLLPFLRKPVVQRFKDMLWDEKVTQKNSVPSGTVISGLNALMATEWTINTKVLEVMKNLFENNTRQANLPAYDFSAFDFGQPYPKDGTKEDQAKWCQYKEEAYSLWYKEERSRGRMLVRLKLAKGLISFKFFYHIFTCDFRGRANAACDLLSPQSSDFDRALIMFAQPQKQTPSGTRWFKVHLANLFDQDKESFSDRIKWVDDNMAMLKAINENPYDTRAFWVSDKKKKNPSFQRLAAIFDLCRSDGLTQVPVQMDGTCNGIQHWAALMKDSSLAKMVNITPTDKPNDCYGYVADLMTKNMTIAINNPDEEADTKKWAETFLAHWGGKISRAVPKRAVMTDPYGVTFYGIRRYCRLEGHLNWVSKDKLAGAVMELATFIDHALKNTLTEANKGKVWLKTVADICSKAGHNIEWTTPCGFKVVHQYYQILSRRSIAKLFNMKELHFGAPSKDDINNKAVNLAISPNFIHSLDASHMWCTVRGMLTNGIEQFSMIHDSFGCPAPYIDIMREITKIEFMEMHKTNLLFSLKSEIETKLKLELPDCPPTNDLNMGLVANADYLFQ